MASSPDASPSCRDPNLAREIAVKQPAASVVACADEAMAELVAGACAAPYFRPYTETDVVGTELSGAVKNVIALAVGMAEGLGMGDNSKASMITRGLAETMRLGTALGGDPVTFAGLAGSATSSPPACHRCRATARSGWLGQGMALAEVVAVTKQTAEGVTSCSSCSTCARTASTCRSSSTSSRWSRATAAPRPRWSWRAALASPQGREPT